MEKSPLMIFIEKKLKERNMTKTELMNKTDIASSTLTRINHGYPISNDTMQKLAYGLGCTQGDIQAQLALTPHPLKTEMDRQEGPQKEPDAIVEEHPEPEEPDLLFLQETEEDPEETLEEFKSRLRIMCLQKLAGINPYDDAASDVFVDIGKALVKELAGDEA